MYTRGWAPRTYECEVVCSICLSSAAMASSSIRRCAGTTARLRSRCMRIRVSSNPRRCSSATLASGVTSAFRGPEDRRSASSCWASTDFDSNPLAILNCKTRARRTRILAGMRDPGCGIRSETGRCQNACNSDPAPRIADPGSRIPDPGTYNDQYMSILPMGHISRRLLVSVLAGLATACSVGAIGCSGGKERASSQPVSSEPPPAKTNDERPKIVVLGDSLTAGLGLPEMQSYPHRLQEKIDADGLHFEVVNAGVSGDTSAGGLRRLDWVLQEDVRVLIVALGANDGLRGLSVAEMKQNLAQII